MVAANALSSRVFSLHSNERRYVSPISKHSFVSVPDELLAIHLIICALFSMGYSRVDRKSKVN